ncbi:M48 family metallopeptidase [Sulfurimonas sp. HSL-1656]|uniref:M48 family metallopeptidase n=1 Tax=Thiomicrolovo subterrani TaxID=3131934 RepID=UPI0031F7AE26
MKRLAAALMLILMIAGCAKTPVTGRSQLILISNEQEVSLGLSESEKLKQSAKLSTDKALTERIRRIGQRIAAVSGRDDFQWEFNVIESDTLNAFCLPGGKVYFYTGLIKLTANDDQIATVMGHEIAHALARHGAERMSMQMVSNTGGQLLGAAIGVPAEYQGLYSQAYGLSTQLGVLLPYSRKHESEADQIGIYLMWKAGFDPNQAVAFWQKMKEASGGKKAPEFLSTHPSDQSRIDAIRAFVKSLPEQR